MAKANRKMRGEDIEIINSQYDSIGKSLDYIVERTKEFMPLVADSLSLTKKILSAYKESFNNGVKKIK